MKQHYLLGLGGALLASTSLATVAEAATVRQYALVTGAANAAVSVAFDATNIKTVSAQIFGTGGVTATSTLGPQYVSLLFNNVYAGLKPNIILQATGASFSSASLGNQSAAGVSVWSLNGRTATTTLGTASGSAIGCAVGVASGQIQINSCYGLGASLTAGGTSDSSFSVAGMQLSGLVYTAATGLATVGATISLGGSLVDANNQTNVFETITPQVVVQSVNNVEVKVLTTAASVVQGTGATPFVSVTSSIAGSGYSSSGLTAYLAEIAFSNLGALGADLTNTVVVTSLVGPLALTITSPALADPAIANVRFVHDNSNAGTFQNIATSTTLTTTATFTAAQLTNANLYNTANQSTNFIQIEYNGSTSITGGAAGTIAGTFSVVAGTSPAALPFPTTALTSAVSRTGFTANINSVQASTNGAVTSYLRLTNSGTVAGTAILTVYNAATGVSLGTYTTASIPAKGTLQLTAAQIEVGAGINTSTSGATSYTIAVNAALTGFAQHITGNNGGSAGLFVDFSGARNTGVQGF